MINVANYNNEIVTGNNLGGSSGLQGSSFSPASFICPIGTSSTTFFLPAGVFAAVATKSGYPTLSNTTFNYSSAHFITQAGQQKTCVSSAIGTSLITQVANGNFSAGFSDVLCLPNSALTRWPDGVNVNGCWSSAPAS